MSNSLENFGYVKNSVLELNLAISKGQPESTYKGIQKLHLDLKRLAKTIPNHSQVNQFGLQDAQLGLQLLVALSNRPEMNVLLDGPDLLPMIGLYLNKPWNVTGISHLAFALLYNLVQTNTSRLSRVYEANLIPSLCDYLNTLLLSKDQSPGQNFGKVSLPASSSSSTGSLSLSTLNQDGSEVLSDERKKKINLLLTFFYKLGAQEFVSKQGQFVSDGALDAILKCALSADHALVFLASFLHDQNTAEVIDYLLSHLYFNKIFQSLHGDYNASSSNSPRLGLAMAILRNLALSPLTYHFVLEQLAQLVLYTENQGIDDTLSALSNLAVTNGSIMNWEAFFSQQWPVLLSKFKCLLLYIVDQEAHLKDISSVFPLEKYFWTRMIQVLRQDQALNKRRCQNQQALALLAQMATISRHFLFRYFFYTKIISHYLEVDLERAFNKSKEMDDLIKTIYHDSIVEADFKPGLYQDIDYDLSTTLERESRQQEGMNCDQTTIFGIAVMWRRLFTDTQFSRSRFGKNVQDISSVVAESQQDDNHRLGWYRISNVSKVAQGIFRNHAFCASIAALMISQPDRLSDLMEYSLDASLVAGKESEQATSSDQFVMKCYDISCEGQSQLITIDGQLPCYIWGQPISIISMDKRFQLLPLLEKACAKALGGRYELLERLRPIEALQLLTGKKPKVINPQSYAMAELASLLTNLLQVEESDNFATIMCQYHDHVEVESPSEKVFVLIYLEVQPGTKWLMWLYDPDAHDKRKGWSDEILPIKVSLDSFSAQCGKLYYMTC